MINEIVNNFQQYPFLQREWFYNMLQFLLATASAITAIIMWRKDSAKKLKEEHQQTLTQIVRNDLEMKEAYRQSWSRIVALEGDSGKDIFLKDIKEINEDHIKICIFQIIDILSDVHYYYEKFEIPLTETVWVGNFQHVFNPVDMQAFVSAFKKYQIEHKFRKEFIDFVNKVIENNQPESSQLAS